MDRPAGIAVTLVQLNLSLSLGASLSLLPCNCYTIATKPLGQLQTLVPSTELQKMYFGLPNEQHVYIHIPGKAEKNPKPTAWNTN